MADFRARCCAGRSRHDYGDVTQPLVSHWAVGPSRTPGSADHFRATV